MNLPPKIEEQIRSIAQKYPSIHKVVLFGSRARGDNRERSDIDLAVYTSDGKDVTPFYFEIHDDTDTLLKFDIVFINSSTDQKFLHEIEKDGVVVMNRAEEKTDKLREAIRRLEETLTEYRSNHSTSIRDGAIKRFEFCAELAWKAAREYLIDQGYTEINSPKSVMKQAYADGLISDENAWLTLLNDRNLTSHLYNEQTAIDVFERIQLSHLRLFHELSAKLGN